MERGNGWWNLDKNNNNLTTDKDVVIINNNMKEAIKYQIIITQYDDDDVQVQWACPDAVTAYGLLAYGQWQVGVKLSEIHNDKASND